jgi:hypothetical protein
MRHLRGITLAGLATVVLVPAAGHARPAAAQITSCGQTVTTNAVLAQNLTCTGDGVVVGASGITIDLNGFAIKGDEGSGDYGVDDSGAYDHVAIKHGVLRNFETGIYAPGGADAISVANVAAVRNANAGLFVVGDLTSIRSSTFAANSFDGIEIMGDSATIRSSTAAGNRDVGISVVGASALVRSAGASANNVGIYVNGDEAEVRSSSTFANGNLGMRVSGNAPIVTGNRADGNGFANLVSDGFGLGITVDSWTTKGPVGTNTARGNDNSNECVPVPLCHR